MATEASTQRESQEKSIKARKNELFVNGEVDLNAAPRKTFRQCLNETPAAPLTKNVKLMLWGSAAPVVLLFLGALLAVNKTSSSRARAPEDLIVPDRAKLAATAKSQIAQRNEEPVANPAAEPKPEEPKPEVAAAPENPPEEKPKPPKNKGKNNKKKPKSAPKPETGDDAAIAKGDAPKPDEASANGDSKAMPNPDSPASTQKPERRSASTAANGDEPKGNAAPGSSSTTPKKTTAPKSLFKKPKPKVFTYPKRDGEKGKTDSGSSSNSNSSGR